MAVTCEAKIKNVPAGSIAVLAIIAALLHCSEARAILNGFEAADGYTGSFVKDTWSYDAGQTGGAIAPNTGRWVELSGSSFVGDGQYASQHGYGGGGANTPPYALAVRSISLSTDLTYDMSLQYALGTDDLGVLPTTVLAAATIQFDICPGATWVSGGPDTVFNNVPAFSLSAGGTNAAPGLTIGFSDNDPGAANRPRMTHYDGNTYNSIDVPWSGHFDQVVIDIDFGNQTYDMTWTRDFNLGTTEFDAGNAPVVIASNAAMTTATSMLDYLYFRAHTDPSNGTVLAGLEKSYLDNFSFSVTQVPEPVSLSLLVVGGAALLRRRH